MQVNIYKFKYILFFFVIAYFFIFYSNYTYSQEVSSSGENNTGSITVYDSEYFKPYNPVSAEDMLKRIPGTEGLMQNFGFNQDEERRGLRSNTDQVLINGKRLTGKQVSSSSFLTNLPAKSVKRIELITGNVRELDTDVGSRVINVVLNDEAGGGSGVLEAGILAWHNGQKRPMTNLSYSGDLRGVSFSGSFMMRPWVSPVDIVDIFVSPQGRTLSREEEGQRQKQMQFVGRGSLSYETARGNVSINGLMDYLPINQQYRTGLFSNSTNGFLTSGNFLDNLDGKDTKWEVSGDISYNFTKSAKLTTLFVYSNLISDRENTNYSISSDQNDSESLFLSLDGLNQLGGDNREKNETEKIIRTTFDFRFSKKHELEFGVEGAVNTLNKEIQFFNLISGEQIDIPIINSDQKIIEDRVEVFSTYSWKPFNSIEIETGVAAEFSWLDQVGSDVSSSRTLNFVKPSINFFYNLNNGSQIYFSSIRDVGQLNFNDFIATVNREDNEILAGNPELVPEKSWDFELGGEYRFPRGAGVFSGNVFYRFVNDVEDLIPLGLDDSQPGNLGSGRDYGFKLETSIRFGRFTPVDAVLSGSSLVRKSSVNDPFTGLKRRFGNQPEYEFKLEGRHDIKSIGLLYGFDITKYGPKIESDYNEFDDKPTTANVRLYMEKKIIEGLILRVFWANATEQKSYRKRTIFNPSQFSGNISQEQFRKFKRQYIYGFRFRSIF